MQGAGHEKAWWYWLMLFYRYELPALFGLAATPIAALRAPAPLRLLAWYGGGTFVAYSVIHYKTPWCVLEVIWPCLFLAAWAIWALAERSRLAHGALLTGLLAIVSLVAAVRLNWVHYADPKEPYIYVQTYPGGLAPLRTLESLARRDPTLYDEPISVVMSLSWPLPWLMGDFHKVAHWNGPALPPGDATVLFVDRTHKAQVEARLHRRYYRIPYTLSPVHPISYAYFDAVRFAGKLPGGTPVFVPSPTPPPAQTR